jgi:hypothetical protein
MFVLCIIPSHPTHLIILELISEYYLVENEGSVRVHNVSPTLPHIRVTPSFFFLVSGGTFRIRPWHLQYFASRYPCAVLASSILIFSRKKESLLMSSHLSRGLPTVFLPRNFHSALFWCSDVHSDYMTGLL